MQTPKSSPPISPLLGLGFGILAVSTSSIISRYALGYAPALVVAAFRLSFASLLLLPLAWFRYRQELAALTRRQLGLALLSGFFLAIHFATWISSLNYTTVASSVVLVSTTPLWVALISPFTLKERLSQVVMTGMVITVLGGVIVAVSDTCSSIGFALQCPPLAEFINGRAFLGDLLALTGAVMGACYLLIGRSLRANFSLISYVFVVYSMAAILLTLIMLAAGYQSLDYPPTAYGWFLALALVPQLLGHSTFNWALRYFSTASVAISLLGEPVASTLLAYLLLAEAPTAVKLFGAGLILAGIYLSTRGKQPVTQEFAQ